MQKQKHQMQIKKNNVQVFFVESVAQEDNNKLEKLNKN